MAEPQVADEGTPAAGTPAAGTPWDGMAGTDRYAACLLAARAGDRRGLNVLVAELTPLVWHVVRGSRLDRATSEDVVQTVWLALLRHLDRLTEPRALVAWLITTARREAYRCQRRDDQQRQRTAGSYYASFNGSFNEGFNEERVSAEPSKAPEPELEVLREDRDRRLWNAFSLLPQHCQELLRLTVLAGRTSYSVVAKALHRPRGSIGPTRGRCLATLRQLFEGEGGFR